MPESSALRVRPPEKLLPFQRSDFVGIPVHEGIRLWGESSIIVDGPNVLNIARYGGIFSATSGVR